MEKKIGYVSQNIFLFNSSIKDNITMFSNDRSVDPKKLNIALKISNLEEKLAPSNMELKFSWCRWFEFI